MKKILTLVLMAVFCLPAFAAKKVSDPVLKINETGSLVVANRSGKTVYMYSITNQGTPSQPETVLPEEGVKLLSSGTYNIIVTAQTKKGKVLGRTNACYRVFVAKNFVTTKVAAGATDTETLAPFIATNTGADDFTIARYISGKAIQLKRGTTPATRLLQIGTSLLHGGKVSFVVKESTDKKVYFYYDGEPITGVKAAANNWTETHSKEGCTSGKRVHFECPNDSRIYGFGLLEQGFDAF